MHRSPILCAIRKGLSFQLQYPLSTISIEVNRCRKLDPTQQLKIPAASKETKMIFRSDNRSLDQMRAVKLTPEFIRTAEGSCLIEVGNTRVICTATIEDSVPGWMRNQGKGWITSEYGMLPRATLTRTARESTKGKQGGRTHEIQRLIGRSMRAIVDMTKLGERTLWIDCDVIQADGGTRTASITGGFVAMALAMQKLVSCGTLKRLPLKDTVAAISVGIVDGVAMLDLAYEEDSRAQVDMNYVLTGADKFIEIQATAEHDLSATSSSRR